MAAALDRERLAKLCGLFSSSHDGERASAAAAADKLVRQAGLRWPDVILPCLPDADFETDGLDDLGDPHEVATHCRRNFPHLLTEWETKFLWSLTAQHRHSLSQKQRAVIARIFTKCQRAAGRP